MSLSLLSTSGAFGRSLGTAFVRSDALVSSLQTAFAQYCSFRSSLDEARMFEESVQAAGQLAGALSTLPAGMLPPQGEAQLRKILPTLSERPEGLAEVLRISDGVFCSDWYTPSYLALTRHFGLARPSGPERLFMPPPVAPRKPLIEYDVVAGDGEVIQPVAADPPQVNMHGYRLIEVAAFNYYLRPDATERLILAPGFTGTGKTDHLTPHLLSALKTRGAKPFYVDLLDRYSGMGTVKSFARMMSEPILILDEVCLLKRSDEAKLREYLRRFLGENFKGNVRKDHRVVLIGGGFSSTEGQRILLKDATRGLVPDQMLAVVPIHVKPLNRLQAEEVLNSDSSLSMLDRRLFTDFILERLPPYLRVLRKFRLPRGVDSLEHAFLNMQWLWEEDISLIFRRACLRPRGATEDGQMTPEFEKIGASLERDFRRVLAEQKH